MRSSPGVRRPAVHQFADGVSARAPKRNLEQALKHEVLPVALEHDGGSSLHLQVFPDEVSDQVIDQLQQISQPEQSPAITLRPLTTEDIDLLWDWTRQDPEGVTACFGQVAKNSRDLFAGITRLAEMQTRGESWINAITRDAQLIGFVLIAPIQRPANQPPVGTVHLYIAQGWRGEIAAVVTGMLATFDAQQSPMSLSVIVNRPEWIAVLEPLGFVSSTVLTRPPMASSTHAD